MHFIKTLLILLNLEIAFGNESIERYTGETDVQKVEGPLSASKRNSAYKRLPGWKVFYGKRSADIKYGDKLDGSPFPETNDINDIIDRVSDGEQVTGEEAVDNWDTSDSEKHSDAFDNVENRKLDLLDNSYENDRQSVEFLDDLIREFNEKQGSLASESYRKEIDDDIQDSKRSGWNAIYGKRMPGWFAGYGKRGADLRGDSLKRAAQWLAMYGKRSPAWFATYGKRAPQWIATYGKRAPQWLATYGKRAPQWLATYGKRAPAWLATYGKRAPEQLSSNEKRAPQWLATYGKRAPQWLATYGKRAPGWIATYGKRSDPSDVNTFNDHLSELHKQLGEHENVHTIQNQPLIADDTYDKRANGGWAALYG